MDPIVFFYTEGHQAHMEPGHPERPERMDALRQGLEEAGWWDAYPHLEPLPLPQEVLGAVHTSRYLQELEQACLWGRHLDVDTYTTPASWDIARRAAGGALAVAGAVWSGQARTGFALTRPPGHHATPGRGMGFCLLNNTALAAQDLVRQGAQRLAILDLDLHHGNGTQEIFWERGDVFFLSIHQSPLYPGTGYLEETGDGPGRGRTANFPLPPGSGDQAYQQLTSEFVLPMMDLYQPEMLLVSFGYDAHWRDPLGSLALSAAGYYHLFDRLTRWAEAHCSGKIAVFLEGGYDQEAARACGQAVVAALLGLPWEDPLGPSPRPEGKSWQLILRKAREIWRDI